MESMAIKDFNGIYYGKRVLITGHTGFKGSWAALWLNQLGADVSGISLEPNSDNLHWKSLNISLSRNYIGDIRDIEFLKTVLSESQPEIILHFAAQSLVRKSYREPIENWTTNVLGTLNILELSREIECLKAIIVVTTDKCYENKELNRGYSELDNLGGYDPYSASKASVELLVSSYRQSFFNNSDSLLLSSVFFSSCSFITVQFIVLHPFFTV